MRAGSNRLASSGDDQRRCLRGQHCKSSRVARLPDRRRNVSRAGRPVPQARALPLGPLPMHRRHASRAVARTRGAPAPWRRRAGRVRPSGQLRCRRRRKDRHRSGLWRDCSQESHHFHKRAEQQVNRQPTPQAQPIPTTTALVCSSAEYAGQRLVPTRQQVRQPSPCRYPPRHRNLRTPTSS